MATLFSGLSVLQAAAPNQTMSLMSTVVTFGLIFVIFYFLIIRPQNKKQKEAQKMIAAIKKGDKVITIGGIHGLVHNVKDNTVVIKVDDDSKIEFSKSAVATVVPRDAAVEADKPLDASK
jgi:preprotein translocase subunit YajC